MVVQTPEILGTVNGWPQTRFDTQGLPLDQTPMTDTCTNLYINCWSYKKLLYQNQSTIVQLLCISHILGGNWPIHLRNFSLLQDNRPQITT
jgi:hypothetical protein